MPAPVTADSSLTADSYCWTADGRIICIPADVVEAASAIDASSVVVEVILAAAVGSYTFTGSATGLGLGYRLTGADAAFVAGANAILTAAAGSYTLTGSATGLGPGYQIAGTAAAFAIGAGAGTVLTAAAGSYTLTGSATGLGLGYRLTGADAAFAIGAGAGTVLTAAAGSYTLTGSATGLGPGYWLTGVDAAFVVKPAVETVDGGGAYYPPLQRPFPVVGHGYGILPQLEGEAHGVVGTVAKGAAQLLVRANAVGVCGQVGNVTATLKGLSVVAKGAVGAGGAGVGVIVKFSGTATGQQDDDEAAVIAILLAA